MTLLVVAIAIVGVMVVVLAAPIHVELTAAKRADEQTVRVRARIRWLGLTLPSRRAARTRKKPPAPRRKSGRGVRLSRILSALRSPDFAKRCRRLVADLVQRVRPYHLRLRGRVGFEDPSDTGRLLGWLYGLRGRLGSTQAWSVRVAPDFSGEVLEGELLVCWSKSAGALLWPLVKFSLSPVVWRGLFASPHFSPGR